MAIQAPHRSTVSALWLGYLFFVVYGSLVPLAFKPMSLAQAWALFQHIPMHQLGIESRADWIANGVLYLPVGFLTAHLFAAATDLQRSLVAHLAAAFFALALASAVEFTQLFFPPRSVSLNDLWAEGIGSLIGIVLAARYADWFKQLLHALLGDPRRLMVRLIELYLLGHIAFSLFPYDLLLSWPELQNKLRGNDWGWLLAGDPHGRFTILLKLAAETLLAIPFGLFLGYRSRPRPAAFMQAVALGALLGGFIEVAQFFTATGVSQGLSIATRALGVCAGLALWKKRELFTTAHARSFCARYALPAALIYLLLLLQTNGWLSQRWNGEAFAADKLDKLNFLPFYYHYYTTEAKALFSLASVCLMYLPIGLLVWLRHGSAKQALYLAILLAALMESGKLFLQGLRPDPTNLLLAGMASWGMFRFSALCSRAAETPVLGESAFRADQAGTPGRAAEDLAAPAGKRAQDSPARLLALFALVLVAYWTLNFPVLRAPLAALLAAAAVLVWFRPAWSLPLLAAALPILDLAPLSGRFYLDEFDLLCVVALAVAHARTPAGSGRSAPDRWAIAACALLALSFALSTLLALSAWPTPDINSFASYFSPYNALRIAKGALFAFLCIGLLRRQQAAGMDLRRPWAVGMTLGLLLAVPAILWERAAFSRLLDFSGNYRVTGPFSAMHTGGAYIECYLAVAAPFLLLLILQTRNWLHKTLGLLLLLVTTYTLMITFSRNGYAAYALALTLTLLPLGLKRGSRRNLSLSALIAAAVLAVAFPVFTGHFAQSRIASLGKDFSIRANHWADALNMRTPGVLTSLFGMGVGRFPESHYLLSGESEHAAAFQLKNENGNTFLRLTAGEPIYVEQFVELSPDRPYVLSMDVRHARADGRIGVSICEKWMLTSQKCVQTNIRSERSIGTWSRVEVPLNSGALGSGAWYARKPVKLAVHTTGLKSPNDVDNIRLGRTPGENLLDNGDFSDGLDHWFFSEDAHLPWHTHSLPIGVLFDQGWFGLLALLLFSALALKRAAARAWRGDEYAAAALAAFSAFLLVGLFDTLIDAPRFLMLFLLLGMNGLFAKLPDSQ